MANHRPKSLSELNQVYDKALQAQRAIKQGSMSLNNESPIEEKPSQNIFEELKEQAAQAKKTELYDADIANIASDFLKRYSQPEQKAPAAKELKRPAPSIQSLYHTPVKTAEQESSDIPLKLDETPAVAEAQVSFVAPTRPKAPESIVTAAVAEAEIYSDAAEEIPESEIPAPEETVTPEQIRRAATEQAQHEAYTAAREVSPTVRVTSSERNDLINEYLRVMNDEDDGYYDDEEDIKPKKGGFWSKFKKRRHEAEPEQEPELTYNEDAENEENLYSDYDYTEDEPVAEEAQPQEETEDVPLSLYDYIEADFDFGENEEIAEEPYAEPSEEAIQEEPEEGTYPTEPEEGTYPTEPEEGTYPTEPEEGTYPTETEEALQEEEIYAEEAEEEADEEEAYAEIADDEVITSEEVQEEVIYPVEAEAEEIPEEPEAESLEESPTAGMVFDDVFSVSDESKRSYTGGDWSGNYPEYSAEEDFSQGADEAATDEVEEPQPKKAAKVKTKKKRSPAVTALLSVVLVLLIICTAAVGALGAVIGVDTGKLFFDKYRAFCAEQNFSFSGVTAGDLVITEDYNEYAAEGESFVYVNHEYQSFMLGKHRGSTYNLTGDVLFIAENEAGRVLVLREDTLGAVTKTYKGLGRVLAPISNNYIIIVAVLLVLCLAVLLALIIPRFRKADKEEAYEESETAAPSEKEEEYEEEQEEYDDSDDDGDDGYGYEDYDTDGIEEGLFSGI